MADRLNDTDPQSPLARVSRTDPGLGNGPSLVGADVSPSPPAVLTPSPGSTSIEELLDGITGPRPPPPSSRRDAAPDSARAYAPARAAPASRPMPPREPLVVSPEPPLYSGVGRAERGASGETSQPLRGAELEPTRPVVRAGERTIPRRKEERTVYTGRRALIRNATVVILSASVVAVMMMSVMRWREAHRPRQASAVVVMPAEPETDTTPTAGVVGAPASLAVTAVAPVAPATGRAPEVAPGTRTAAAAAGGAVATGMKPAMAAPRRVKAETKPAAPAEGALDDLNRQIRH